jgi:hypothetical protein
MCSKIKISPYLVLLGGLSISTSTPFSTCEAMDVEQARRSTRSTALKTMKRLEEITKDDQEVARQIAHDVKESKELYEAYGSGKKRARPATTKNNQATKKRRTDIIDHRNDPNRPVFNLANLFLTPVNSSAPFKTMDDLLIDYLITTNMSA